MLKQKETDCPLTVAQLCASLPRPMACLKWSGTSAMAKVCGVHRNTMIAWKLANSAQDRAWDLMMYAAGILSEKKPGKILVRGRWINRSVK